jgi:DNA processing protein
MTKLDVHALLTVALLRQGADTHAARHLKVWLDEDPSTLSVRGVAERVFADPADIQPHLDRAAARAEEAIKQSRAAGFLMVSLGGPDYPAQLAEIADPPPVLWVLGDRSVLSLPSVGVVGSRSASPVSLMTARTLARELAEAGVVVTSGLARGVDGAAHEGALEGGGATVAVMGSGLDVVYPAQHASLARRIASQGAVVTELPPGARPHARHFPLRNRIISGLSRAVLVVEASERSGSLITARMALDQNRDVLAVPGSTLSGSHRVSHRLIKDGARLVETVGDVLDEIGWDREAARKVAPDDAGPLTGLAAVMALGEPYSVDELATRTGRPTPAVLVELGELELAGRVTRVGGGRYARWAGRRPAGE